MSSVWSEFWSAWRMNRAMKQALDSAEEFGRQGYRSECLALCKVLRQIASADLAAAEMELLRKSRKARKPS